jgi:hypothetical protein
MKKKMGSEAGGCSKKEAPQVNIITAAILSAGVKLGAKQRGPRLLPECIALVAEHLKKLRPTFSRSTIYHWIKLGHLDNVDLVVVRTLAELAGMRIDQFGGDGNPSNGTNGNGPEESGEA